MANARRLAALVTIWMSYIGLYLNRRNVSVAIPALIVVMGLSHSEAGLLVTVFFIAYAAMQIPWGWLSDTKGGRWVLVVGNSLTSVTGYLSGAFNSYSSLLAMRLLCGVGQGAGWPSSSKLVAEYFPERRGIAMGFLVSSTALGSFLALVFSGFVLETYGWRLVFIAPAITLAAITVPLLFTVRDSFKPLHEEGKCSWSRKLFSEALEDWGVRRAAVSYFFWKYSFEGLTYWLPSFLIETYIVDPGYAALLSGCITLTGLISMPLGGHISDRVGGRAKVAILSLTAMGVLMLILPLTGDLTSALFILFTAFFIMEMSESVYFTIPVDRVGFKAAGTAVGVVNLIGQLGSLIAPWTVGVLVDQCHSYVYALAMLGISAFLGVTPLVLCKHTGEPV